MIWYDMIWYDMILYDMILENFIIWYHMTSYDIIWHRYHMILSYYMILENLPRTSRQTHKQTNRQRIQLQRPLLSPVDRRGERANIYVYIYIYIYEFNDLVKIRRSSSVQAEWPLTSYTSSKEVDLSFSITLS